MQKRKTIFSDTSKDRGDYLRFAFHGYVSTHRNLREQGLGISDVLAIMIYTEFLTTTHASISLC